ncbi:hypothetical protein ROZALSC1DRAFT_26446 [Rozella allomycis CSF55]|uniref:Nuclear speckle splicing regulatory protein 1 N-terminal domain-containing protein n=1 Tax=Rozella allomycis (strain CSF55) TaxID=988480 RepID=A0A075ASN7_ROZAC|nr:hypothetical protein O9G_000205 [Rozella allomycis CSF55]RKP22150.1 hypothetical protein ROZALSC1DRAFT_26446 [Rozella allomycis CSF55]|eukprot:EPZ31726.1 hypothetical protein O9G_000205 [Rozella allomycis CSF55]
MNKGISLSFKNGKPNKNTTTKLHLFSSQDNENDIDLDFKGKVNKDLASVNYMSLKMKNVTKYNCGDTNDSIYYYDETYEDSKPEVVRKESKQPKYIEQLKKAAEDRKNERNKVIERKIQKQIASEQENITEKFITPAYKEKLLKAEREVEDERIKDDLERNERKDMVMFYKGIINSLDAKPDDKSTTEQSRVVASKIADKNSDASIFVDYKPETKEIQHLPLSYKSLEKNLAHNNINRDVDVKKVLKTKNNDVATINNARERYLARKRMRMDNLDLESAQ